jgi:hypothetical protein
MEDIARLKQRVAGRETSAADDEGRVLIEDAQMENPKNEELGCIYLTARRTSDGRDLIFIAERCIYNPATDDNVPLGGETFRAASFSEWLAEKVRAGWRFCG